MKILIYDSGKGLLSIVREIIRQKKKNSYYLFIDKDYFPLGEKRKEDLKEHLEELLLKFLASFDKIIIACNTMSLVYKTYFKLNEKVILILDYNLKSLNKDDTFLATPLAVKLLKSNCIKLPSNLANYIEKHDIKGIIKVIRKMKFKSKKVVLGCTHYPLVKAIFTHYHKNNIFVSYESELVRNLVSGEEMSFTSNVDLKEFLSLD